MTGVIGLTTALVALEGGKYQVTIVARDFPGDKKSVGYTSPWAGGKWWAEKFKPCGQWADSVQSSPSCQQCRKR